MSAFRKQLKNPKHKFSLILLAAVVLFMQCYLLQHKIDHHHDHHEEHGSHEIIQDCQLCIGAEQTSQLMLPTAYNLSLSLIGILIVVLSYYVVTFSPVFLLPHTRAPPRLN